MTAMPRTKPKDIVFHHDEYAYVVSLELGTMLDDSLEVVDFQGEIEATADDDTRSHAGDFHGCLINVSACVDHGLDILDASDEHGQEALRIAEAIIDPRTQSLRAELDTHAVFDGYLSDILSVHDMTIRPAHRGHGLGLATLDYLLRFPWNARHVIIKPFPIQFTGHADESWTLAEANTREPNMEYSRFTAKSFATAHRKLRDYWSRLGFEPIPNTEYLRLNHEHRRPIVRFGRAASDNARRAGGPTRTSGEPQFPGVQLERIRDVARRRTHSPTSSAMDDLDGSIRDPQRSSGSVR